MPFAHHAACQAMSALQRFTRPQSKRELPTALLASGKSCALGSVDTCVRIPRDMVGEIISRGERRRKWSAEEKIKMLTEALEPGATVSAVADRNGISRSQLYAWMRLARDGSIPGISLNGPQKPQFVPVRIEAAPPLPAPAVARCRRPSAYSIVGATGCDGTLRTVGEDRTQILEYIPGHFKVREEVRPAGSCNKCGCMVQPPMPALPIPRGQADASVLAHVAVAKYCDHLPLYRQSEIYARDGVELDRSLLADWMGKTAWLLQPLAEKIEEHVMAGTVIHADDTPVKVLAPGNGKTKTGRFWAYLRDKRPHGGSALPAVVYHYTPDRKGEHCRAHLAPFSGHLHADGYAGFGELYRREGAKLDPVIEVGCWSHARRPFFDVHASNGSPIAKEALERIGVLFDIERPIAGKPPEVRQQVRAQLAKPRLDELAVWLDQQRQRIPGRSELAKAIPMHALAQSR